ncbi:glycoside hydrolase family 16 protein [Mucilaginibacter sp. L3T2-6]|uniref:glycoside hydrolase family 16 protein n=1 Tax=Mucilaginibacter sp. L3T2-6 TaxID=3062491 RepID=UPI0026750A35|nr:glycoside hydrolase family 16 protein [Mucilaginibacter sp. L3T2-6]MDO3641789.1 glycoside hydrolase family 16 protein [Mucilaginibacter sp. L3T2-6]MDV6214533.1 glycoside hydrolase family 16 protein [Mucilaginibacter sp. L3T2-6]
MTTSALIFAALVIFAESCSKSNTPAKTITATTPDKPDPKPAVKYTLSWSEEFSGPAIDTAVWNMETGSLGINNEKEYYQAQNAAIEDGNLVITAKKENVGGMPYTSARMNTLGKFSATYGRVEARIKLPSGLGFWPAFWMLGANINTYGWPRCGEIDIMEHINDNHDIYGTMHWQAGGGHSQYGAQTTIASTDDYHIYAVEWDETEIRWYVDDALYLTGNIKNNINSTEAFHLPFFIILNFAVAGDFPGQTVDESKLPAKMYVDYVRVYKAE